MLGSRRRSSYIIALLVTGLIALAVIKQKDVTAPDSVNAPANGPSIQSWQTEKGARVLFVQTPELPMVDIRLVFTAGSARDADRPGLARLTNLLLDNGAGEWTTNQIAERFENIGAAYSASALRDMAIVGLRSLSEEKLFEEALLTLEKVLQKPRFEQAEFQREIQRTLVALENQKQSPDSITSKLFYQNVFKNHPYSSPVIGTEESIKKISVEDVHRFYQRYYVARNAVIAIVGALDRKQAEKVASRLADGLEQGKAANSLPQVEPTTATQIEKEYPSS